MRSFNVDRTVQKVKWDRGVQEAWEFCWEPTADLAIKTKLVLFVFFCKEILCRHCLKYANLNEDLIVLSVISVHCSSVWVCNNRELLTFFNSFSQTGHFKDQLDQDTNTNTSKVTLVVGVGRAEHTVAHTHTDCTTVTSWGTGPRPARLSRHPHQDYAIVVCGGGFGWCATLNWTHLWPQHSVWDI